MSKKIAVLCHDLSHNCLGRAHIIALALSRYYEVEIYGPASNNHIWAPLANDTTVKFNILSGVKDLKSIEADMIYAIKPKGRSFGYALKMNASGVKRPIVLDIDDWEMGEFLDLAPVKRAIKFGASIIRFWNINNIFTTSILDRQTGKALSLTVSNSFLQEKYGGVMIPHFRDTKQFDPKLYNGDTLKSKYGLDERKVILFLGTLRKHKGILDLINGVEQLNRDDVTLLIVGATDNDMQSLPKKPFLKVMGRQPFDKIPEFLSLADIVVLFQSQTNNSKGQLPAKVFDAMSMGKPIIASNISDLPKVLKGCGELVEPGDINMLQEKMKMLLDHEKYAANLGKKARRQCIRHYSYGAIAPQLRIVVESALSAADNARRTAAE